ncbi:MAG: hypothetical protein M4579_002681 [Chaenotheca gracillima]|nr:MAG: hypothetical protein M4579_002681 [Chaenotheca gracillima]
MSPPLKQPVAVPNQESVDFDPNLYFEPAMFSESSPHSPLSGLDSATTPAVLSQATPSAQLPSPEPQAGYTIQRSSHDFTKLTWNPPMHSDELWIALKLAFPNVKSDQERRGAAVRNFLLQEKIQDEALVNSPPSSFDAYHNDQLNFNISDAAPVESNLFDFFGSDSLESVGDSSVTPDWSLSDLTPATLASAPAEGPTRTSSRSSPASDSKEGMMAVLNLDMAPATERKRRIQTDEERQEVRDKRRLGSVCLECKKKKKKCPHALANVSRPSLMASQTSSTPRSFGGSESPSNSSLTGPATPMTDSASQSAAKGSILRHDKYKDWPSLPSDLTDDGLSGFELHWDFLLDYPIQFSELYEPAFPASRSPQIGRREMQNLRSASRPTPVHPSDGLTTVPSNAHNTEVFVDPRVLHTDASRPTVLQTIPRPQVYSASDTFEPRTAVRPSAVLPGVNVLCEETPSPVLLTRARVRQRQLRPKPLTNGSPVSVSQNTSTSIPVNTESMAGLGRYHSLGSTFTTTLLNSVIAYTGLSAAVSAFAVFLYYASSLMQTRASHLGRIISPSTLRYHHMTIS